MTRKILFIGSINFGRKPRGGAEAKNQILVKKLKDNYKDDLICLDMSSKISKILFIFYLLRYQHIVLSISSTALEKLSYFSFLSKNKKLTIFIIGGIIDEKLSYPKLRVFFERAEIAYAETKTLRDNIEKQSAGINVHYLPNFKRIPKIKLPIRTPFDDSVKLVYLSRVNVDKGIFRAIELTEILNRNKAGMKFSLDIYGGMDLDAENSRKFDELVNNNQSLNYNGFLNFNDENNYVILSQYHFFIFLTNHHGEGFPGVLIDAMISEVPIVASDWKYNEEILTDQDGQFGIISNLSDDDYFLKMKHEIVKLTVDVSEYNALRRRMKNNLIKYDVDKVDISL